jgi:hypothetical protein
LRAHRELQDRWARNRHVRDGGNQWESLIDERLEHQRIAQVEDSARTARAAAACAARAVAARAAAADCTAAAGATAIVTATGYGDTQCEYRSQSETNH